LAIVFIGENVGSQASFQGCVGGKKTAWYWLLVHVQSFQIYFQASWL